MRLRIHFSIATIFTFLLFCSAFVGCNKGVEPLDIPIETLPVIDNQGDQVLLRAKIQGVTTSVNGFLLSTIPEPTLENGRHIATGTPVNDSIQAVVKLDPSTPAYYVRAYAYVDDQIYYGNEVLFSTGFAIGQAYGGGRVAYLLNEGDPGYDPSTEHGFCLLYTSPSPRDA